MQGNGLRPPSPPDTGPASRPMTTAPPQAGRDVAQCPVSAHSYDRANPYRGHGAPSPGAYCRAERSQAVPPNGQYPSRSCAPGCWPFGGSGSSRGTSGGKGGVPGADGGTSCVPVHPGPHPRPGNAAANSGSNGALPPTAMEATGSRITSRASAWRSVAEAQRTARAPSNGNATGRSGRSGGCSHHRLGPVQQSRHPAHQRWAYPGPALPDPHASRFRSAERRLTGSGQLSAGGFSVRGG